MATLLETSYTTKDFEDEDLQIIKSFLCMSLDKKGGLTGFGKINPHFLSGILKSH